MTRKLAGVPVVCYTMHNPLDVESAAQRRWLIWAARLSEYTVCASHHVRHSLEKCLPRLSKERVGMIYNATAHPDTIPRTDEKTIRRIREEAQCTEGEKLLVCVARLTEQKGHTVLLKAFRKIRDRGHPVKLALVPNCEISGRSRMPAVSCSRRWGRSRKPARHPASRSRAWAVPSNGAPPELERI